MKVIDIHSHIYPDDIALKATKSIRAFYGIDGAPMDGTAALLLERNRMAGVEQMVILPVAIRPDRVQGINDFIQEKAAEQDCFIPFGTVHAGMEGLTDEVERLLKLGVKGIKMHPDSQRFAIDDERLFPMYEAIRGRIPVMLHMGDQRYNYSHPVKLRKVLELFPGLDAIAAHFGGYSMQDVAYEQLKDTDCVMDISSSMMFMPEGEAEKYIRAYGPERMLFGTDFPLWNPVEETQRFLKLKLTDAEFEQIGSKTALRVLGEL